MDIREKASFFSDCDDYSLDAIYISVMKYTSVEKILRGKEEESFWKSVILKSFLLGLAFGTGCYIAKVIINCPLMTNIVDTAAEGIRKKALKAGS
jgi:hypothetical protein